MQRYTEALPAVSQTVNAKERVALERTAMQHVDSGAELVSPVLSGRHCMDGLVQVNPGLIKNAT